MANGHIHDPVSNGNGLTSQPDCKSDSGTDSMEDTAEFRVMMAFAKRRRQGKSVESSKLESPDSLNGVPDSNGASLPQTPVKTEKETPEVEEKEKKRKKRGGLKKLKHITNIFRCIKPQTDDEKPQETPVTENDVEDRCFRTNVVKDDEVGKADKFAEVASRLAEIADEIPFTPPELEADGPDDDVEKVIGLLLRESGDRLNDSVLGRSLSDMELFWNYNFFETLIKTLLRRMGLISDPNSPGPQTSPKTQIAITCEVASRLSATDTVPMSRMLGFGATYLQNHFSSWTEQQGGLEAAFDSEDEDEDVQ
ncbi:apoptosis facilitator Bcl-2-like protein 14 [Scomber scombrus]|uniref:Apoptosis facilitator Bcl-2-like protein 14 n=1 Tax=Scomber scombrus TaxID=13677 RepID=A0AAV1MSK0_SCOSC|nr:apoptosis facilitator Bcl-2-like protein 14 [Scomber scombrus]